MKRTTPKLLKSNVRFDCSRTTDGVVPHAGLAVLADFCDRTGLSAVLSPVIPFSGRTVPVFDRGRLLSSMMLMLADGGDRCTDYRVVKATNAVLGVSPSERTLRRMISDIAATPDGVDTVNTAFNQVRGELWRRQGWCDPTGTTILDIDATLVNVHTEKQDAQPTFRRGFGFHPIWCFADRTGEALAVKFRPGNAAANTIADLVEVIDRALDALPAELSDRYRPGAVVNEPSGPSILVRSDSAAATRGLTWACWDRDIRFSFTGRTCAPIESTILGFDNDTPWEPALPAPYLAKNDHEIDPGRAQVTEITGKPAIVEWLGQTLKTDPDSLRYPPGTRVIIRREPLHPGAQQRLFDVDGWRHTILLCDTPDVSAVEADRRHREHARVEAHIKELKALGHNLFPFKDTARNNVWTHTIGWTQAMLCWWRHTDLADTELADAQPKRLRYTILHTPALAVRTARQTWIRWPTHWPWTPLIHQLTG